MPHVGTCAGTGVSSPGFSPPGPRWHPSRRAHSVCDREDQAESRREAGAPRFRASVWGNPPRSRGYELAPSRPSAAPSRWQSAAGREPRIALGGTGNPDRVKLGGAPRPLISRGGAVTRGPAPSRSLLLLAPPFPAPTSFSSRKWSPCRARCSVLLQDWLRVLSLRLRKCFLCQRRRGKGSLAFCRRLWGCRNSVAAFRDAPAWLSRCSRGWRRLAAAAADPGRAAWVSWARRLLLARPTRLAWEACVFPWRPRVQSWQFSFSCKEERAYF